MSSIIQNYEIPEDQQWFNYILDNIDKGWDFKGLSSNPQTTMRIFLDYPDMPWDMYEFSRNKNVFWSDVEHPHNANIKWDYRGLSQNDNITIEIMLAHPDRPWDFKFASRNKNMTWEIVLKYPHLGWSYPYLGKNQNITWDIIKAHPKLFTNYTEISKNININIDIVRANLHKKWNYYYLSQNPRFTPKIIQDNPDIKWDFNMACANPNMNILQNIDVMTELMKISKAHGLYYNPNLTFEIIQELNITIQYQHLSWNPMSKYQHWNIVEHNKTERI